jgi:virginiamycin A acetyltransferase
MGLIQSLADKVVTRLYRGRQYESQALRTYFKRRHDIDIGLYSFGAFDRWRIPPGTRIGRYCSIALSARLIDADHPFDALSTHPYFYLADLGLAGEDRVKATPPVVEDDVWIGHNAIVTPGAKRIGHGAVIGAGSVVTRDVPRYAIVAGVPAKVLRLRFSAEVIEAIEATGWWLLDKESLRRALVEVPEFATAPSVADAARFTEALKRVSPVYAEHLQAASRESTSPAGPSA